MNNLEELKFKKAPLIDGISMRDGNFGKKSNEKLDKLGIFNLFYEYFASYMRN
jgi:hypothetical protein